MIEPQLRGFTGTDVPSDSIYNQCVRCGLCLPNCPTYLETLTETSGPRGRISLIKAVGDGHLDVLSPGFVHQMSECLDCRACEAVCPSGVHYGQLVETARTQIQRAQPPSGRSRFGRFFTLRLLFANLGFMRFVAVLVRLYQRSGFQTLVRKSGVLRALKLEALEAMTPVISARFFIPQGQVYRAAQEKRRVFLHAGCVMHVAFAEANRASVRMLQRADCTVVVPEGQGCCGAITVHAGDMDGGRALARRNIAAFERSGAEYYVINAAGCGSTLKEYGEMFAHDPSWAERARDFSTKVRDITELLDEFGFPVPDAPVAQTVTYQDPCHLAHAQRITSAPRNLLGRVPGLKLVEMAESSVCCGSAGVYNLTQPDMAQRLQARKIEHTVATRADAVVTANPGCALQLRAGLAKIGSPVRVKMLVELLDDAYANSTSLP